MWYAALMRFIRRRIVLGIIFTLSLMYCVISFVHRNKYLTDDVPPPVKRTKPFIWRTLQEHNYTSEDERCRNSVQGILLIVDDRGYVCKRFDVLPNGCCNIASLLEKSGELEQYACKTCINNNCCAIYEYCISCCLHPDKKAMLETVLGKASEEQSVLLASVTDHFELCLALCRTNSQSVQHETSYKDPEAKYCYGKTASGSLDSEV